MATAENQILSRLSSAPTFHPASADLFTNWAIEPGDVVRVKSDDTVYNVPVYSMNLRWTGDSKVEIESTGNQKRDPLPALKRKQYASGRGGYGARKEMDEHYSTEFIRSNRNIGLQARAIGVKLDENGYPIVDDHGDFVFDDENGAEIYSRLMLSANRAQLVSAINNGSGQQISGAKIDLSATGSVLIEAINNRNDSTVTIRANRVNLDGYVTTSQLNATNATISNLTSGSTTAGYLRATSLSAVSNFYFKGGTVGTSTITVDNKILDVLVLYT